MESIMLAHEIDISGLAHQSTHRTDLWLRFIEAQQTQTMAEVGVWKGEFAEAILRHSSTIREYYLIDPWAKLPDWNKPWNVEPEVFEAVYSEMDERTRFASEKRRILRGRTKDVSPQIPDESIDLAYIDGDHTLRGITIDLIKMWPKIKPGGFIGGDDFTASPWQHDERFEPTLVCPLSVYFAEAMDAPFVVLPFNQFVIRKKIDAGFSFTDTTGLHGDLTINTLRRTI